MIQSLHDNGLNCYLIGCAVRKPCLIETKKYSPYMIMYFMMLNSQAKSWLHIAHTY